jgi:predicted nucleic acid-binding protein
MELYREIRGKREEDELQRLRELCNWLDFDAACWELAGSNGRICLRAGVNVPTGDLLVYSCARRHGARLLHRDRHFDLMDAACSL